MASRATSDSAPGAGDLVLIDDHGVGELLDDRTGDLVALVADDDLDVLGAEMGCRGQHVTDE